MKKPEFIHLDACNFMDYPIGGTLSFACQMRKAFGNRIALAGIVSDDTPCGRWIVKKIEGINYYFFGIGKIKSCTSRPIVPVRLSTYCFLKKYIINLLELNVKKIFTQTPQFMLMLEKTNWESICFCFAGTGNSVELSRYPFLRFLGGYYEKCLFRALNKNADCILAAADAQEISATIRRSKGALTPRSITTFPTRFDDAIFYLKDRDDSRSQLALSAEGTIIVVVGRLCWVKGWKFIIKTFQNYICDDPSAKLIFVGDGEDRKSIESDYSDMFKNGSLQITGHISPSAVSLYLGASNLLMMGSYQEGWPTAIVEALACGRPIISTNVSGIQNMIVPGENGVILFDRDPQKAAEAIKRVLRLKNATKKSYELAKPYRLNDLHTCLEKIWLKKYGEPF